MEAVIMLLIFDAFLVLIVYKMDLNEKKAKTDEKDLYQSGFMEGIRQGMNWGVSREEMQQKSGLRKKDK